MIKKEICLILALLLLTSLFTGCCISAQEPTYTAYGTVYINNNAIQTDISSTISTQCVPESVLSLHETYIQIGNSNKIRNILEEQFPNEQYTYIFESVDDTEIIKVSVTSDDSETSAKICNGILDVYPKIIAEIIEGSSCKIIDYATVPTEPDKISFFP